MAKPITKIVAITNPTGKGIVYKVEIPGHSSLLSESEAEEYLENLAETIKVTKQANRQTGKRNERDTRDAAGERGA